MGDSLQKNNKKSEINGYGNASSSSEDEIDSEEDEDLILEGVLVRNPEIASSSDDDDDDDDGDDSGGNGNVDDNDDLREDTVPEPKKKRAKVDFENGGAKTKKRKHSKSEDKGKSASSTEISSTKGEPEMIPIVFTFHDMNEKFYHGVQNQLSSQPIYAPLASDISSIILENISVGTVVSSEDGGDNVFGFASVLNVTTYNEKTCIKSLKKKLLDQCPKQHKDEMEIVLSGKTKRPAGFFVHGRMVNMPLEITFVLHEQLVLDMDWAVDNAEGGEEERKSLNFGAFIVLAPCSKDNVSHSTIYKNFDDEIFAGCAEFVYSINLNKGKKSGESQSVGAGDDDQNLVSVIVLTKTGHRDAMKEFKKLIHG